MLNRHQLQVTLVEMSHLIITLGEAAAASIEELTPVLKDCIAHRDHGVRLEAATAYTAVAQAFPTEGRKFVIESLSGFSANMDAMQLIATRAAAETTSTPKGRFRKGVQENNSTAGTRILDQLMQHQCHMHGNALTVSMLMHQFPHVLGGIPRVMVDKTYDVCEKLLLCQTNEAFVKVRVLFCRIHCIYQPYQPLQFVISGKSKCSMHMCSCWLLHAFGHVHYGSRCSDPSCHNHIRALAGHVNEYSPWRLKTITFT